MTGKMLPTATNLPTTFPPLPSQRFTRCALPAWRFGLGMQYLNPQQSVRWGGGVGANGKGGRVRGFEVWGVEGYPKP